MFSRFDNMMQHTQTHNNGKAASRAKTKSKKRSNKRDSTSSSSTMSSLSKRNMSQSSMPSSPEMSSDDSEYTPYKRPRSGSFRRDPRMPTTRHSLDESPPCLPPPSCVTHEAIPPVEHLIGSWHSKVDFDVSPPTPVPPLSPPMSGKSSTSYLALRSWRLPIGSSWRRKSLGDHRPVSPVSSNDANFSILPKLATYLVKNPDKSPESFYRRHRSFDSSYLRREYEREPNIDRTRRLSVTDLCNPIESLYQDKDWKNQESEEKTISVTADEFEALQGFSRFRLGSTSKERCSLQSIV